MNAIKTIDLCKQYGNKNVVNHLNITVPQGAIYGFIGRNGARKSTTQKMVCGLTNPTGGAINLFERSINTVDVRQRIGTLIEEPGIYPEMTALNNVIMQGYNIGTDDIKKRAVEALEVVGLGKAMKKKAKNLSLGMRQRLGLAVAMLGEPELLVLDEPINGLDPEGIVHLRQVIEQLQI
jgi:ABC-type multidrug transport system ATPase subunit